MGIGGGGLFGADFFKGANMFTGLGSAVAGFLDYAEQKRITEENNKYRKEAISNAYTQGDTSFDTYKNLAADYKTQALQGSYSKPVIDVQRVIADAAAGKLTQDQINAIQNGDYSGVGQQYVLQDSKGNKGLIDTTSEQMANIQGFQDWYNQSGGFANTAKTEGAAYKTAVQGNLGAYGMSPEAIAAQQGKVDEATSQMVGAAQEMKTNLGAAKTVGDTAALSSATTKTLGDIRSAMDSGTMSPAAAAAASMNARTQALGQASLIASNNAQVAQTAYNTALQNAYATSNALQSTLNQKSEFAAGQLNTAERDIYSQVLAGYGADVQTQKAIADAKNNVMQWSFTNYNQILSDSTKLLVMGQQSSDQFKALGINLQAGFTPDFASLAAAFNNAFGVTQTLGQNQASFDAAEAQRRANNNALGLGVANTVVGAANAGANYANALSSPTYNFVSLPVTQPRP